MRITAPMRLSCYPFSKHLDPRGFVIFTDGAKRYEGLYAPREQT